MPKASDLLVAALEAEGVDIVFGIPGGAILPAYDPDIVILAHRTIDDTNDPVQINVEGAGRVDDPGQRRKALEASIEGLVTDLRADGRTVVIVEPVGATMVAAGSAAATNWAMLDQSDQSACCPLVRTCHSMVPSGTVMVADDRDAPVR